MPAKASKSPTPDQRAPRPGSVRAFAGPPTSVDIVARSFDVVITTETPVVTWIEDPRVVPTPGKCAPVIAVGEVLVASGVDLSRAPRMQFIDCHDVYGGVDSILGKVDDVRVDGPSVVGRIKLTRQRSHLIEDIAEGFYGQISAGYFYDPADAEFVEQADGGMPLLIVSKWTLTEVSNVAVSADPNAFIRSLQTSASPGAIRVRRADSTEQQESSMNVEEIVSAAEAAIAAAEEAIAAAEDAASGEGVADIAERVKALRGKRADEDGATPAADEQKADGERADAEEKAVEDIRSIAKSYGMVKLVNDMRSLGAKPSELKDALKRSIAARSASTPTAKDSQVEPALRAAPEKTEFQRARSAYDKLNGKK